AVSVALRGRRRAVTVPVRSCPRQAGRGQPEPSGGPSARGLGVALAVPGPRDIRTGAGPWAPTGPLELRLGARPRGSALAVEEAGDRALAEHLVDRPGDQRRDREHGELVDPLLLRDRQRVRDDDLADPGVLQAVGGTAGEDAVGGRHDDLI